MIAAKVVQYNTLHNIIIYPSATCDSVNYIGILSDSFLTFLAFIILSLSLFHTHTQHTHTHTHTHTVRIRSSRSCDSVNYIGILSDSFLTFLAFIILSLSLFHTHTHRHSLSLSHIHTLTLSEYVHPGYHSHCSTFILQFMA